MTSLACVFARFEPGPPSCAPASAISASERSRRSYLEQLRVRVAAVLGPERLGTLEAGLRSEEGVTASGMAAAGETDGGAAGTLADGRGASGADDRARP